MEPLELFDKATQWASEKVHNAVEKLDQQTPCDEWNVQQLTNHMCDTMRYFAAKARGEEAQLDVANPPDLIGRNAGVTYDEYRQSALAAFGQSTVDDPMQPSIAFCDQLIHAWDLAKATEQDTTMPTDLADAAWNILSGNLPDERKPGGGFKSALNVADNVPTQDKLLAYTGRNP